MCLTSGSNIIVKYSTLPFSTDYYNFFLTLTINILYIYNMRDYTIDNHINVFIMNMNPMI